MFKSKEPKIPNHKIEIKGLEEVKRALSKIGKSPKETRSLINKALRPAAQKAVRALKGKYKYRTKNKIPGQRYDASTKTKSVGKSIADSIGIITARKSKEPGLFVGTRLKHINPTWVADGDGGTPEKSRNLPAMLIEGTKERFHKSGKSVGRVKPQKDFYKEVVDQKGSDIIATAQRDLSKMLDRMIKQAGF